MILRTSWPDLFGHRRHRIAPDEKVVDARDKGRAEGQQKEENKMLRRTVLKGMAATAAGGSLARSAAADTPLKIGISIPLTGAGFNAVGRQLQAALKLYMQQHGDTVAGRKIELIIRDDSGVADNARRLIQEMIVDEKVDMLGIGITPTALAIAPLATEAKKVTLVMSSGASITTTKSPYFARAGFILPRNHGFWPSGRPRTAASTSLRWSTTGPGRRSGNRLHQARQQVGGEIMELIRIPLANPDFGAVFAAH
jgi:branched-chain amino acid transport system substrate-binding protein